MKPIDFRNTTFAELQSRITGQRAAATKAWAGHGPGTTAQVAERSGMSVLNLRPRTTELVQLGFVCLDAVQPAKGEGRYRLRTPSEHAAWYHAQHRTAHTPQRELSLF